MSTALWLNIRKSDSITCNEVDYFYIYKYTNKLDKLSKYIGITPLSQFHDLTEIEDYLLDSIHDNEDYNDIEKSNNAAQENSYLLEKAHWFSIEEGITAIEALLVYLKSHQGIKISPQNDDDILSELEDIMDNLRASNEENTVFHLEVMP